MKFIKNFISRVWMMFLIRFWGTLTIYSTVENMEFLSCVNFQFWAFFNCNRIKILSRTGPWKKSPIWPGSKILVLNVFYLKWYIPPPPFFGKSPFFSLLTPNRYKKGRLHETNTDLLVPKLSRCYKMHIFGRSALALGYIPPAPRLGFYL